jgi:hypothetical protein
MDTIRTVPGVVTPNGQKIIPALAREMYRPFVWIRISELIIFVGITI